MSGPIFSRVGDLAWQQQAACADDPDRMFPDSKDRAGIRAAKQVCHGCPVLEVCQSAHLFEPFGVWGGLDEDERAAIRKRARRAA